VTALGANESQATRCSLIGNFISYHIKNAPRGCALAQKGNVTGVKRKCHSCDHTRRGRGNWKYYTGKRCILKF
jgi:hypothetical protein